MKKIIMLFFVFVVVLNLPAQNKIILSELNIDQLNLYKEKAIKLRNTGIIMTFAGGIGATISAFLLSNYMDTHPIGEWGGAHK